MHERTHRSWFGGTPGPTIARDRRSFCESGSFESLPTVFSRDTWLIANVQRFVKPGKESWHHDHVADFFDIFSARVLQHQVKGALQRRPERLSKRSTLKLRKSLLC